MFCVHCGKEINENALFCTFCGEPTGNETETTQNTNQLTAFLSVFSGNNFRLATLFFLVSVVASAAGTLFSGELPLPILEIFLIISFFKLKSLSPESAPHLAFASPLKTIRIIVNIQRIIIYVLSVIFIVCGLLLVFSGGVLGLGLGEIFEDFLNETDMRWFGAATSVASGIIFSVIGIIFIVLSVILALFGIFMYNSFYKTAKSAEWTAGTGSLNLESLDSTKKWIIVLMVFEIFSLLSLIGGGTAAIFNLVSVGFSIAFMYKLLKCIDEVKNSGQIENF